MKKPAGKLILGKETLAALEGRRLQEAAAGYSSPNGCTHPCPVTLTCIRTC
ncbi:MAG: hypothetical protein JOZ15_11120 [Acidobacteria bacterium]|nr:hypothetical protein [Acidobacteriota bacterium]